MHADTKWARKIISLQDDEGKWGYFHSLSQLSNAPMTTEQALRRLKYLGFTIEDNCIKKAVGYMNDCLTHRKEIPDRSSNSPNFIAIGFRVLHTILRAIYSISSHQRK